MGLANRKGLRWSQVAGISVICGLAVVGCDRSDKDEDTAKTPEVTTDQPVVTEDTVDPAVSCDNPMVQDRLKNAIKSTLEQQAQTLAANYANEAEVGIDASLVNDKVDGVLIDVQNAAVLQEANASGMTTCQASVSMTLSSEDIYQASQVRAANNQPSLQTRLAEENIRINNNMLVDDAFAYVAGTQGGQVQARIAGQPALITIVSNVIASSVVKSALDQQEAERRAQADARRREAARLERERQAERRESTITPVEPITPIEPTRPTEPATPSMTDDDNANQANQNNNQAALPSVDAQPPETSEAPVRPELPKVAPDDDSIDMTIIEDENATY